MPSQVWKRDTQDAFDQPYEYGIQEQFVREAEKILRSIYGILSSEKFQFTLEDRSLKKAVLLLATDGLDALRDCLASLKSREHRLAGRMFRDVMECMDTASYLSSEASGSAEALGHWYGNEVIRHSKYRDHIKKSKGPEHAERLRERYGEFSKFTHRSYGAILDGYILGAGNRLCHDRLSASESEETRNLLVLPQTISVYYAVLGQLILEFLIKITDLKLVSGDEVAAIIRESWERETVPRRFMSRADLIKFAQEGAKHEPEPANTGDTSSK